MSYFVTGATGFIGRNLVEQLLEREGTIYVLVREGSKGRLEELRNRWGADEERVVGIVGDLSEPRLGRLRRGPRAPARRGRPPLPPRRDLRHDRRRRVPAGRQRRGHPPHGRVRRGGRGRPRAHGQLDRRRRPLQGHLARGHVRGGRRTSTPTPTSGPSTSPRASSATSASGRGASTGPGSSSGNSETGEMDKVDGPYYFFKLIRRIRNTVPQWMPMPGVEGREINIVPVDFVVRAMDHIAHLDGPRRPGVPPHRPEPADRRRGDRHLRRRRARAAVLGPDARRRRSRRSSRCVELAGSRRCRSADTVVDRVLADFGIPRSVLIYVNYPTHFDSRQTQAALEGTGIRVPPLEAYAGKLWDYWERHLDPDLFRDRTLIGAARGRMGLVGGHRAGRRAADPGRAPAARAPRCRATSRWRRRCAGAIVMVTGASSGIGKSAAMKIADAGGIVLLVARTPEKLEATREQIEAGGGRRLHPPLRPLRHRGHRPDGGRGARAARPRRRPGQQRRALDPALGRALLRPLPRLRAHDAAQLLRRGAADPQAAAGDARAQVGPHHQRQLDRRADEHAAVLGLRRLEVGARRVLALRSPRRSSTTASTSRRSTCRWCGRR